MELCCRRTKPSVERFRVPPGTPTPHNCFKRFCWRARLSPAGHRSGLLRGQSHSLAQSVVLKTQLANKAIAQVSSCSPSGCRGSTPGPTPTVRWGTGHRPAPAPTSHLPPATRSRRCGRAGRSGEREQPSPSQAWLRGCLESSVSCSKRCEWKINLNNYCPRLAWPCPSAGLPRTWNVLRSPRAPQPPPRGAVSPA